MEDWRLSDPDFTQFEPRTVQEAILRFRRMQRKGLSAWRYPEKDIFRRSRLGGEGDRPVGDEKRIRRASG